MIILIFHTNKYFINDFTLPPPSKQQMWTNKLENPNSSWLSLRGTWLTNVLIAMVLKVAFTILPGVTPEISWTLTNLTYNIVMKNVDIIKYSSPCIVLYCYCIVLLLLLLLCYINIIV